MDIYLYIHLFICMNICLHKLQQGVIEAKIHQFRPGVRKMIQLDRALDINISKNCKYFSISLLDNMLQFANHQDMHLLIKIL